MTSFLEILSTCTKCDNCRSICPENAIFLKNEEYFIDDWSCTQCSLCIEVCPVNAVKLVEASE